MQLLRHSLRWLGIKGRLCLIKIEDLRSSAKITELTMGNLLTKSEKPQSDCDRKSPKGCFGRLFSKKNNILCTAVR